MVGHKIESIENDWSRIVKDHSKKIPLVIFDDYIIFNNKLIIIDKFGYCNIS